MPPFNTPKPPTGQPLVTSFHADTCGTCRWAHLDPSDVTMVECRGAPPTPLFAPTNQGMQLVLMRPRMPRNEGSCGVHQPKPAVLNS